MLVLDPIGESNVGWQLMNGEVVAGVDWEIDFEDEADMTALLLVDGFEAGNAVPELVLLPGEHGAHVDVYDIFAEYHRLVHPSQLGECLLAWLDTDARANKDHLWRLSGAVCQTRGIEVDSRNAVLVIPVRW